MNAAVTAAQRSEEVRAAARAWREGGFIDETTEREIDRRFPDDRVRAGLAFRILLVLATLICGGAAFGLAAETLESPVVAWLALVTFAALTEVAVVAWRFAGRGPEEATATLTFVAGFVAVSWSLDDWVHLHGHAGETVLLLAAVALAAAIVWRWGMPCFAGIGTAVLLWWVGRHDAGRLLLTACALLVAALAVPASESRRLAPAHRSAAVWGLLTALGFLYLALNVASYDHQWVEHLMARQWSTTPSPTLRVVFIVTTVLLPVVTMATGVRLRNRPLLLGGTLMVVLSLVTVRHYVHLAPLWLLLTGAGLLAMGVAAGLRRFLDSGPGRERHGFTAQPLAGNMRREELIKTAVALSALQPTPEEPHASAPPRIEGGGGQLGGGGASGDF